MSEIETDNNEFESNKNLIREMAQQDGKLVSPIDLSLDLTTPMYLEGLKWVNFDDPPAKMKLTNTGETVIISGKWATQRPYLAGGSLDSNYVFSQIHFHWGSDEHEGSEHTVRGIRYPMEVHVVFFKTRYLTQEAALKNNDGVVIVVYLVKLQNKSTAGLHWLASQLSKVVEPKTSTVLPLSPLSALLIPFSRDYLLYWGSLETQRCSHTMLWMVSRAALSINVEDLNLFRNILNSRKETMTKNFRDCNPAQGRSVFHVNPSADRNHFLLPGTIDPPGRTMIVNFTRMPELTDPQARELFNRGDFSENESLKSSNSTKTSFSVKHDYLFGEGSDKETVKSESDSEKLKEHSSLTVSPRLIKDPVKPIKNKNRENVIKRKMLEKQRKEELERLTDKGQETFERKNAVKKLGKLNKSASIKSLPRATEPYIVRKPIERRVKVGKSIPPTVEANNNETNGVCLHLNMSQASTDVGSESVSTQLNAVKTNKPAFKSRLPMLNRPVLKSSLAPYFSRPDSAQSKQDFTCLKGSLIKPATPKPHGENIKRPIISTIPQPRSPMTPGKIDDNVTKPMTTLQKQCSG